MRRRTSCYASSDHEWPRVSPVKHCGIGHLARLVPVDAPPRRARQGTLFLAQSQANTTGVLGWPVVVGKVYSNLNVVPLSETCSTIVVESVFEESVWVMASTRTSDNVTL